MALPPVTGILTDVQQFVSGVLALFSHEKLRPRTLLPPPPLIGLPAELLRLIFHHLPLATLLSLSLTSKATHAAVVPHIYGDISMCWKENRPPRLDQTARSLLENPRLATHTRRLALKSKYFRSSLETVNGTPLVSIKELPMGKAGAFIKASGLPQARQEEWSQALALGSVDALVTLLIALLPNLTSLYLGQTFTVDNGILGHFLSHHLCQSKLPTKRALRRLNHVTFVPRPFSTERHSRNNSSAVLPLFYLPVIQHLKISIDNPLAEPIWPGDPLGAAGTLSTLTVHRVRERRLGSILRILPNLTELEWHWFYQPDLDQPISSAIIDLDVTATALAHIASTVVDLRISASINMGHNDYYDPDMFIVGSLKPMAKFGRVRRLQIPWVFLMGFSPSENKKLLDCVPRYCETLTLTLGCDTSDSWTWHTGEIEGRDGDTLYEAQLALTAAVISALEELDRSAYPNLQRVVLEWCPGESCTEQMQALRRIYDNVGVEVCLVPDKGEPYFWNHEEA